MKPFLIAAIALLLMPFFALAQDNNSPLRLSPAQPMQGQQLKFEYNAAWSPLIKKQPVSIVVYEMDNDKMIAHEPTITRAGSLYKGSVMLNSDASLVAFAFFNGESADNNNEKNYIFPVFTSQNKVDPHYFSNKMKLVSGQYDLAGNIIAENTEFSKEFSDALAADPKLLYEPSLFFIIPRTDNPLKDSIKTIALLQDMHKMLLRTDVPEDVYASAIQVATRAKNKSMADSLSAVMQSKYPAGNWAKRKALMAIQTEKDSTTKAGLYNDAIAKGLIKPESAAQKASKLNATAWKLAETGGDLATAEKQSRESLQLLENYYKDISNKPSYQTKAQFAAAGKEAFGQYADTYAYILYKQGNYKDALTYGKKAAESADLKDADLNERYAQALVKTATPAQSQSLLEKLYVTNAASETTTELLKENYMKRTKSSKGYDAYIKALDARAAKARTAEVAKKLINKPAPDFELKDYDGKSVKLSSFKGQTVVVDFWATWCGPCIASMPAMAKAQAQNPNVKFLFIDTWERVENDKKLANSQKFMKEKGHPFYVLMDNDNKAVTDYGVTGIPTKFVIDAKGNIRFKSVGFEGDNALIKELKAVFELVK